MHHSCDIFNANETALLWEMLPSKTLAYRDANSEGRERQKRPYIGVATNADESTMLQPLLIVKSKSLRCQKNALSVPVNYRANGKTWMTGELSGSSAGTTTW